MATVSGSSGPAVTDGARSGGKIVTKKRRTEAATPYDRPTSPPPPPRRQQQPQGSPNWLTGVVFPATRMIASGAVKIISSVFDSSSSSSSSSESEAEADGDVGNDDQSDYPDDVNHPNKKHLISSEATNFADEDPQLSLRNCVTKTAIERLLMQERFSRQERDRLMQIIDSRVINPIVGGEADVVFADLSVGDMSHGTAELCAEAVMEARKWIEIKKVGSSPSSDFAHESHGLDSVAIQHIENESGSPVDVAKLYMKSCPLWASPLAFHNELQSPSSLTRELFKDGTSASFVAGSLSSSKKRSSLASGSWNIEEELRRVRSKASEDMLSSLPSRNIDISLFRSAPKSGEDSVLGNFPVTGFKENNSNTLVAEVQPVDASKCTATGLSSSIGISDPRLILERVPIVEDARGLEGTQNVNGLYNSQSSLSEEMGTGDIRGQPDEILNSTAIRSDTKTNNSIQVEDMCELLSEASVEVPIMDETNGIADISKTISSVHHEELSFVLSQPNTDTLAGADDGMNLKPDAKKPGKLSKRGRGRGK